MYRFTRYRIRHTVPVVSPARMTRIAADGTVHPTMKPPASSPMGQISQSNPPLRLVYTKQMQAAPNARTASAIAILREKKGTVLFFPFILMRKVLPSGVSRMQISVSVKKVFIIPLNVTATSDFPFFNSHGSGRTTLARSGNSTGNIRHLPFPPAGCQGEDGYKNICCEFYPFVHSGCSLLSVFPMQAGLS